VHWPCWTPLGGGSVPEVVYLHKLDATSGPKIRPDRRAGCRHTAPEWAGDARVLPRPVLEHVLAAGWSGARPGRWLPRGCWTGRLAAVRERGVAEEPRGVDVGIACVAAPVLDADGRALAAISITRLGEPAGHRPVASAVRPPRSACPAAALTLLVCCDSEGLRYRGISVVEVTVPRLTREQSKARTRAAAAQGRQGAVPVQGLPGHLAGAGRRGGPTSPRARCTPTSGQGELCLAVLDDINRREAGGVARAAGTAGTDFETALAGWRLGGAGAGQRELDGARVDAIAAAHTSRACGHSWAQRDGAMVGLLAAVLRRAAEAGRVTLSGSPEDVAVILHRHRDRPRPAARAQPRARPGYWSRPPARHPHR